MHLERLDLKHFRSCFDSTFWFRPDLTVLLGENNGGKSNAIDAIRLLTPSTDGRRSRYCDPADLSFAADDDTLALRAAYRGMSEAEQALMLAASDGLVAGGISYRLQFTLPGPGQRRGRTAWTVGPNDAADPEPEARERIRHVYLPPLRDAQQALSSGAGDRIEFVLRSLAQEGEIEAVESTASDSFASLQGHALVKRADLAVKAQMGELTAGTIPQASELGFVDPNLRQLARALRVKLGEHGLDPVELSHSGLGYANLLYLATVAVELESTKDADLTIFLVEEPEAHLHPQMQSAVLDFLMAAAERGPDEPGSVQVIITTHSPQLASSVASERLEVVKSVWLPRAANPADAADPIEPAQDAEGAEEQVRQSRAIPIWKLDLSSPHRRKVDRYLDATRSAMLFGPRVLLVEGIAELLLLPSLARRVLTDPQDLARFGGTSLVGIGGVDFEPYVRVLLSRHDGVCVAERVVVITDTDPGAPGDRVGALAQLAHSLNATDRLVVKAAAITLEASLIESGNDAALKDAFLAQRPQSAHIWESQITQVAAAGRPQALVDLMHDKRLLKGDFAQSLAAYLDDLANPFSTPGYLAGAIKSIAAP